MRFALLALCLIPGCSSVTAIDLSRPLPEHAQLLSAARSDVALGARVADGLIVSEGLPADALGPEVRGLSEFTQIASRKAGLDLGATIRKLVTASLGVGGDAVGAVSVTNITMRQVKSLEALGKTAGHYVWQVWAVDEASFRLTDAFRARLEASEIVTKKIADLGLTLSADRSQLVVSKGKGLVVAVVLIEVGVEAREATTRIDLAASLPQDAGFGWRLVVKSHSQADRSAEVVLSHPQGRSHARRLEERKPVAISHGPGELGGLDPGVLQVRDQFHYQVDPEDPRRATIQVVRSLTTARQSDEALK